MLPYVLSVIFDSLGSTGAIHPRDQHVCQCLPHDAAGQRHLDTICHLDGTWYVTFIGISKKDLDSGLTLACQLQNKST